jgi:hypothetical protein
MNVTLLRWTIETALSSQVVSSGQYKTYVCSSVADVDVRMMYNPDLRMGQLPWLCSHVAERAISAPYTFEVSFLRCTGG